jgi:hypothetical protein
LIHQLDAFPLAGTSNQDYGLHIHIVFGRDGKDGEDCEANEGRKDSIGDNHLDIGKEVTSIHIKSRTEHDWWKADIEKYVLIELQEGHQ